MKNLIIPSYMQQSPRYLEAVTFAIKAHEGQERKYTGEAYIVHPIEVADLVHSFADKAKYDADLIRNMTIAALLHDTVEDCEVTYNDIEKSFGVVVRNFVFWLTDVTSKVQGNRRIRKELELERILHAPGNVKDIKICDLLSNTKSIVEHDKDFARVYLSEKGAILAAFRAQMIANGVGDRCSVNKKLLERAERILNESRDAVSAA